MKSLSPSSYAEPSFIEIPLTDLKHVGGKKGNKKLVSPSIGYLFNSHAL